jgi:hypothetical protein
VEAQAQATTPELRPLGVGEVLDVGIKIYWRNARTFFRIVLLVVAPVEILSSLISSSADVSQENGPFATSGPASAFADTRATVAAYLLVTILGFISSTLATGACFKAVAQAYLGEKPTWRGSIGYAGRRLHSIIWVAFLANLVAVLGLILCIIPGVYLWVAFALAVPVLLTEGIKGTSSLGRSKGLVEGRWWPTFAILLVGTVLAGIVGGITAALAGGFQSAEPGSFLAFVVGAVSGTVGSMISTPFVAAFTTVLYFDLRVRKEGFDLQLLAERIGLAPPAEGAFRPAPSMFPAPPPASGEQPPYWPPPPGWRPSGGTSPAPPGAAEPNPAQPSYWPPPGWTPPE